MAVSTLFSPTGSNNLSSAVEWITSLLFGSLAIGLCIIAVAFIGMLMLTGRIDFRRAGFVVIGCFVLLGAPMIATGFIGAFQEATPPSPIMVAPLADPSLQPRVELPPSTYDPYGGASLRRD